MKTITSIFSILVLLLLLTVSPAAQNLRPELLVQTGHSSDVNSIAFSPDGKFIASGGSDSRIEIWDVATGLSLRELRGHTGPVLSVAISPDGKLVASGSADETIRIWDVRSGVVRQILKGHGDFVTSVGFSPDGKLLASGSVDRIVRIWSVLDGRSFLLLKGHSEPISSIAFSPDGRSLASGSSDGTIKFWSTAAGRLLKTIDTRNPISSVIFTPNGKEVISSEEGVGDVAIWDIATGKQVRSFANDYSRINSISVSKSGRLIAGCSQEGSVTIWDVNTKNEPITIKRDFDNEDLSGDPLNSVAFSPDGASLAVGGADTKVHIFAADGGKLLEELTGHAAQIYSAAMTHDRKLLAFGRQNASIAVWNTDAAGKIRTLAGHQQVVTSLAFSPDSALLASGSADNTVKIWDVKTGNLIRTIKGHRSAVRFVRFSSDNKLIASADVSDVLYVWNVQSGEKVPISSAPPWVRADEDPILAADGKPYKIYIEGNKITFNDPASDFELFTLTTLNENDWFVSTKEGFFDGTPNAWKQLSWRFNNDTFDHAPVETYFNDFFYPNLLRDVLDGRSPKPKAGSELEKIDRRQPKVEIAAVNGLTKKQIARQSGGNVSSEKRSATVTVEVADNTDPKKPGDHGATSGAQDLRLFRNGSLVKVWHDDVFKLGKDAGCEQIGAKTGEPRHARCQVELPIVAGDNNFTAYAFNSSNVKSNDDSITVQGADSLKRDGTLYVLAVGVNKYANSAYDLNFAVPDVEQVSTAIKTQQDKIGKETNLKEYAKTETIMLTDENATKDNILLALQRFSQGSKAAIPNDASDKLRSELAKIQRIEPEDSMFVYYAGHGTSRDQRFYLLPHNFTGKDEESLRMQGVSDIELNEYLEKVDAGRLLMVIDACQSGQVLGADNEGRGPMNSKGLAQLAYDKGMLILTAAQSQQAALEAVNINGREIKHGLLTYSLLVGLTDPAADKDGNKQIWEREWLDFAAQQVPLLQLEAMKQRHDDIAKTGRGAEIVYVKGDKNNDPSKRMVQTPRIFYRREAGAHPFIVAVR